MNDFYAFILSVSFGKAILAMTFVIALVLTVFEVISLPFEAWNRYLRAQNIQRAGWPPNYLDADGDPVPSDLPGES